MKKISFMSYFLVIAVITVISGTIYSSVQQVYRTGANDPQVQIARNINLKLQHGKSIENFFTDTVYIAQSLSVFSSLYDPAGKLIRSSGYLRNKMPAVPEGVFEFAKKNGEYEVTWQPQPGVRMAMVIVRSTSFPVGFVACGRSLQQVEERTYDFITSIFFGWIICIALVLLHASINFYNNNTNFKNI